ncbi:MAG: hypothetical protein AB7U20_09460 [Planctomycetaceae bacterium]
MNNNPDADRSNDRTEDHAASGKPKAEGSSPGRAAASKRRSKTERNIVWGAIAVLLVVLGFELRSYIGFKLAYDALTAAMEADANHENAMHALTEADVKRQMKGIEPVKSERLNYLDTLASRVDTYEWSGLLRTRSMYVYYGAGDNPDVLSVSVEKGRTTEGYYESIDTEETPETPAHDTPADDASAN